VQTFVPVKLDTEVAKVLDNKRLNKQALEAWQILMVLTKLDPMGNHREPKGWVNHPAVKMWRGHEGALSMYAKAMVIEWKRRGYNSTIGDKVDATVRTAIQMNRITADSGINPDWRIDDAVMASHRLALLVKDYEWYSQFGWPEDPGHALTEYEYVWPVE
jgi:hypothetical protein